MFDWINFLDQAVALLDRGDEAGYRSAISRAYYAAYHAADDYAELNGLEILRDFVNCESHHHACWRTFSTRYGQDDLESVGETGDDLRTARNDADYRGELRIGREAAEASIGKARQIIETLRAAS